jgi:hypothetical protein
MSTKIATLNDFVAAEKEKLAVFIAKHRDDQAATLVAQRCQYRELIALDELTSDEQTELVQILQALGKTVGDIGRDAGLCRQVAAMERDLAKHTNQELQSNCRVARKKLDAADAELKKTIEAHRLSETEFLLSQRRADGHDQLGVNLVKFKMDHPDLFD